MSILSLFGGVGGSLPLPTAGIPSPGSVLVGGSLSYPPTDGVAQTYQSPFSGEPNTVFASMTDGGLALLASARVEGLAYKLIGFRVGRGGYDTTTPTNALPITSSVTELDDPVFPPTSTSPEPFDRIEYATATENAVSLVCRLDSGEALAGLGEIGIYAEILESPADPTEVGNVVLFSVAHRPLFGKTTFDVGVWRFVHNF